MMDQVKAQTELLDTSGIPENILLTLTAQFDDLKLINSLLDKYRQLSTLYQSPSVSEQQIQELFSDFSTLRISYLGQDITISSLFLYQITNGSARRNNTHKERYTTRVITSSAPNNGYPVPGEPVKTKGQLKFIERRRRDINIIKKIRKMFSLSPDEILACDAATGVWTAEISLGAPTDTKNEPGLKEQLDKARSLLKKYSKEQ